MKILFLFSILIFTNAFSQTLKDIRFVQEGDVSKLVLEFDQAGVKASKFHLKDDKQIIIDVPGVSADNKKVRSFDTSEFSGTVVFVSPYKRPSNPNDLRIAIQLRDNARSILESSDKKVELLIENRFGAFSYLKVKKNEAQTTKDSSKVVTRNLNIPKSEKVEDILENLTMSGPKKYIGVKISINVKDVPVADLLKMISKTSGFNIILDKEVLTVPNATLNLTNVPWDQALDTILSINKLVANKNGNILMITTLSKATKEKELEIRALELSKQQESLVTTIFPISYANLTDIEKIIKEYLTKDRGKISTDTRTNSLIVKDTADTMEKIRKIIETLDTQTAQILIEAKIVEISERYSKDIGLTNGLSFGYDPIGQIATNTQEIGGADTEGFGFAGPGFAFNTAPSTTRNMLGLSIGRLGRLFDLSLTLQLMEEESKARIVSSPRIITENKKAATIQSKDTESFSVADATNVDTGVQTRRIENVEAELALTVTPQVTNEGSISMEVDVKKSDIQTQTNVDLPPPKNERSIKTSILVDNGSTVVIGGIYRTTSTLTESGIPFLKDIPLVGWLFRNSYNPARSKSEMVIFLTPRIINQEEAGLVDDKDPLT